MCLFVIRNRMLRAVSGGTAALKPKPGLKGHRFFPPALTNSEAAEWAGAAGKKQVLRFAEADNSSCGDQAEITAACRFS
jgi:hypothetical protein